jgi:deazaflavin-dependent oxidoreductase (nitroreductase family)
MTNDEQNGTSFDPGNFNQQIIEEFRTNEGRVGGMFEGAPLLLLTTTGAQSGRPRIAPLAYSTDNGRLVVIASKGGAPTNPDWYHNVRAHPEVTVEVGTERFPARASIPEGGAAAPLRPDGGADAGFRRVPTQHDAGPPGDRTGADRVAPGTSFRA